MYCAGCTICFHIFITSACFSSGLKHISIKFLRTVPIPFGVLHEVLLLIYNELRMRNCITYFKKGSPKVCRCKC